MNRFKNSTAGVTLLEIMLVLAIAAMVIVMSVRYYQSATASQQANQALMQMQAIMAGADALGQPTGNYSTVNDTNLKPLLANSGGATTPWGTTITITAQDATSYTVKFPSMPAYICGLILGRVQTDKHYSGLPTACADPTDFTYKYSPFVSS